MNAAVMRQAFEVFDRVREAPAKERERLIDSDESLSDEIRIAVRDLLRHDSPTGEFLGVSLGAATASLTLPLQEIAVPIRIGRYRILRELGRGGFGRVYLAEQDSPKRNVAIKVLRAGFSRSDAKRLVFEAEALARLDHPGIARVYESGTCDDADESPFIAMEYIEGAPLDRFIAERGCSTADRLVILEQVADSLEHAHQRGVLHRDLSPKNILVDGQGMPRLIDFGLAHALTREAFSQTMTLAGSVLGTLRYMSPEQLNGSARDVDTRSDVFALGIITFEVLSGVHPFIPNEVEIGTAIRQQLEASARRPASRDRALKGDCEAVLLKGVERDPTRRYQSAAAFAADLRALRLDEPVAARSYSAALRLRTFCGRHRVGVGIAVIVGALLISAAASMAISLKREEASRNAAMNALDAIVTHVITPMSPRIGTLDERERLLEAIAPDIELMARRTPEDSRVARIAGAYYGAAGDVMKERDRHADAVEAFARSIAAYERARSLGDGSLATGHAFSLVCVKQGDAFGSLQDGSRTRAVYERALAIDTSLASQYPNDLRALSNLFWSHWRFAGWGLSEMHGDHARDAEIVMNRMRGIASNDWRTLEAAARVFTRHAIELGVAGKTQEAMRTARSSLDAARELLRADPASGVFLKILIEAACVAGGASLDVGDRIGAKSLLDEASRAVALVEPSIRSPASTLFFVSVLDDLRARLALLDHDPARALQYAESRLEALDRYCPMETVSADLAMGRLRMLEVRALAHNALRRRADATAADEAIVTETRIFDASRHCTRVTREEAGRYRDRALARLGQTAMADR